MDIKDSTQFIMGLMKSHNIEFWLDGKSLRAVVEGGTASLWAEKSLYLSILSSSLPQMEALTACLQTKGYRIKRYTYQGDIFRFSCHHTRGKEKHNTHVQVFSIKGETAYSPRLKILKPKNGLVGSLKFLLKKSMQRAIKRLPGNLEAAHLWVKPFFKVGSYLIPAKYFGPLDVLPQGEGFPVPRNYQEYLDVRYNQPLAEKRDFFSQPRKPVSYLRETEYQSFTEILHQHHIPYAMDSGVLLALMREGKIFEGEMDIDLQMWIDHAGQIMDIMPELTSRGWQVTIWLYGGLTYQFRIQRPGEIPIHIMLFRKYQDRAWCPASRDLGNPYPRGLMQRGYNLFNKVRKKMRRHQVQTDITRWPWKVRRDLATWWVPAVYFEEILYHDLHHTYIPAQWHKYLQFRYGDWKKPALQWNYWQDDGAIKHKTPEELTNHSGVSQKADKPPPASSSKGMP